jgi:hypothetical protein
MFDGSIMAIKSEKKKPSRHLFHMVVANIFYLSFKVSQKVKI